MPRWQRGSSGILDGDNFGAIVSVGLEIFPSISDWGRVRGTFDINLRREIVSDFFLDLQLYASYDSDPPSEDAASSDYGFVTSLGWSF